MATVTMTGSLATANAPVRYPSGSEAVTIVGRATGTLSISAGCVILLCKIPNQATITDAWIQPGWLTTAGSGVIQFGVNNGKELFSGSANGSTLHRMAWSQTDLPFRVSVTDNAVQHLFLTCLTSVATTSTLVTGSFMVQYVMP